MAKAKKLPSGNWRVLVYAGTDASGKRKYESFTAETKSEAEFLASEYKLKRPTRSSMTLGEAIDSYIESKSAVLSPSTVRGYRTIRNNYMQKLMNVPIKNLTEPMLQNELNICALNLSPKTVRNINGLLVPVMSTYRSDFVFKLTLPQAKKKEIKIPSQDEMIRITKLAEDTNIELPILLASQCGLRASEIAGLTYDCIDYKRREITIKQALVYSNDGNVMKSPKSYSGYRTIPCGQHIIDRLGQGKPSESVLNITTNSITKRWMRFMNNSGEEYFNFHALRHYFCSQALLLGIPKKYVAELMGHASDNMINRVYEHTFKDKKKEFADIIVSYFDDIQHKMQHE